MWGIRGRRPFAPEAGAPHPGAQAEVESQCEQSEENQPMLRSADIAKNPFRPVGEQKAERRHRGDEDRGSRGLRQSEAERRYAKGAGGKEGGHAETEHKACGEDGPRPMTLDSTLDRVESCRPEEAGEYRQCDNPAPVAAPGQIDDPVGACDRGEADHDHIAKSEYVLVR